MTPGRSILRLARLHPRYRDMIMAWAERGEEMIAGQIDGTVGVLAELKAGGMRCLALSNMEPATFATRRARFTFMSWLDGYVISGIEGVAKPDRRIFDVAISMEVAEHFLRPQVDAAFAGITVCEFDDCDALGPKEKQKRDDPEPDGCASVGSDRGDNVQVEDGDDEEQD